MGAPNFYDTGTLAALCSRDTRYSIVGEPVYARYGDPPLWGPPGPHNARDMGTGGPQISSVIGTGGGANLW